MFVGRGVESLCQLIPHEQVDLSDVSTLQRGIIDLAFLHLPDVARELAYAKSVMAHVFVGSEQQWGKDTSVFIIAQSDGNPSWSELSSMRGQLGDIIWRRREMDLQVPFQFEKPFPDSSQMMPIIQFRPRGGDSVYIGFLPNSVEVDVANISF